MKMGSSNDKEAVKAQYASSKGLDTRINFHNMYSTNKMGFGPWLISNYEIKEGMRVLELGAGTGDMWKGHDDLIAKCKMAPSICRRSMVPSLHDAREWTLGTESMSFR